MTKADNTQGFSPSGGLLNLAPRASEDTLEKGFSAPKQEESAQALYQKAQNLFTKQNYAACLSLINRIYNTDPNHQGAMELQGLIAMTQSRFEVAEIVYTQLHETAPENPDFKNALGEIYLHQSRFEDAAEIFNTAHALQGDTDQIARTNFGLSKAFLSMGLLEEAKTAINRALEQAPQNAQALYTYVNFLFGPEDDADAWIKKLKGQIESSENETENILLYFALSKLHGTSGDIKSAFNALEKGCALKRKNLKYDSGIVTEYVDSIINYFSKNFVQTAGLAGSASARPVFIVAMPRSGTTLLEQMLVSHPDIASIGESAAISGLIEMNSYLPPRKGQTYPLRPTPQGHYLPCQAIAQQYDNFLLYKKGAAPKRVINKAMATRFFAGLIYMMFPNARFIHIKRNPADCLLSCLNTNFTGNTQPYSYDMNELGRHYRDHARLMEHWESVIPQENWLNMDYESLVSAPETQIKQVLDFIGLNWDPACLKSETNKNHTGTASAAQVREPVHTKAIGKWAGWEDYARPLLDALKETE